MAGFGSAQAARRLHHASRLSVPPAPPFDGVFFDTNGGDAFTDLIFTPSDEMEITPALLDFAKADAGALGMDLSLPTGAGQAMRIAFDRFTMEAHFTIQAGYEAGSSFFHLGMINDVLGRFTGELRAHPANLSYVLGAIFNANAQRGASGSQLNVSGTLDCTVRYRRQGAQSDVTLTFDGTERAPLVVAHTMTATSDETPRMFSTPVLRAEHGAWTCSSLSFSVDHVGARFAFVGDSLMGSRFADSYEEGAPQLLRADYPENVLVASAPSARTADWLDPAALDPLLAMQPQTIFILLGANDLLGGVPVATIQANLTALVGAAASSGATPVVLSIPPLGHSGVDSLNAWIAGQGWHLLDITSTLRDPGAGGSAVLKPEYDSGDGVHWNSAANLAVYNLLTAYIAAEGL